MTLRQILLFLGTVAALLMADVLVRAIFGGYDAAEIGGFDVTVAIAAAVILVTRTRLGLFAKD